MNPRLTVITMAVLLLVACDNNVPGKAVTNTSVPPAADKVMHDTEHTARNSLDWIGRYQGVLPCADCEGIQTTVVLQADGHYELSQLYLGKSAEIFTAQGKFSWSDSGSVVLLEADLPRQFFVAENQLFMLDAQGKRIEGELAARYRLQKQP